LDAKAEQCIFLGYDRKKIAYRFFNPRTARIITSIHARFDERVRGAYGKYVDRRFPLPQKETWNNSHVPEPHERKLHRHDDEGTVELLDNDKNKKADVVEDKKDSTECDPEEEESPVQPRRSTRVMKKVDPGFLLTHSAEVNSANLASFLELTEQEREKYPLTVGEALLRPDAEQWKAAINAEWKQMETRNVFQWVQRPKNVNVVGSKWVFTIKHNADGSIEKYKARFVDRGFSQQQGVDYFETYAPVAKMTSLRILLSICLHRGWQIRKADAVGAYLNADIEEDVYLEPSDHTIPPTDKHGQPMILKLKKSLYGIKQSGRNWNKNLDAFFQSHGLKRSAIEHCLYTWKYEGDTLYTLVTVDDFVYCGSSGKILDKFLSLLQSTYEIKDLGALNWHLGMEIKFNGEEKISINQRQYINNMLEKYG
jgi:hypothetical protein